MARTLVRVIDSHTGGEPTRVVVEGGPDLGKGSVAERLGAFRTRHDDFRRAVIGEPRGSDQMVGALLLEPVDPAHAAGVIYFNNVGTLGMCGHGTMGLLVTLEHLGRIKPGRHRIETPVGVVTAALGGKGEVSLDNVPSFRYRKEVRVSLGPRGWVTGDVAWGGNWFFIAHDHGQELSLKNLRSLSEYAGIVRQALVREGVTGAGGSEIDHVELVGPPSRADLDSRNFVLCPGGAYDRSPCGTGTSAKLACLHADGKLPEGKVWRQESIVGSVFEGSVRIEGKGLIPVIKGSAFVTAEATLVLDPLDPFARGLPG
jgi:4-hydroxyproline epimerase